jgi:hypothetical protein
VTGADAGGVVDTEPDPGALLGAELDDAEAVTGALLRNWLYVVTAVAVASIPPMERTLTVRNRMTSNV